MNLTTTLKASVAAACVLAFAGCTDLKPIQAQIDDLKSQVAKLQGDVAKSFERCSRCARGGQQRPIGGFGRAEHRESGVVDGAIEFDCHRSDQREDRSHVQEVRVEVNPAFRFLELERRGHSAAFFFAGVLLRKGEK